MKTGPNIPSPLLTQPARVSTTHGAVPRTRAVVLVLSHQLIAKNRVRGHSGQAPITLEWKNTHVEQITIYSKHIINILAYRHEMMRRICTLQIQAKKPVLRPYRLYGSHAAT